MSKPLQGRKVLLGVAGSIAAYKAADIASQLGHLGADVHAVLTRSAAEFIGPATFRAITLNPVLTAVFDEPYDHKIAHIDAAQTTDLVLVAPASADILAKMANGIADDILSTILLATTAPIMVAPAMNTVMYDHPATQENIRILKERGVHFIDPAFGILACRTEGQGKLASVDDILAAVVDRPSRKGDLQGVNVLITAGATREPLDPVRFISNRSSGKMGFAIAEAAIGRGATVTVIAGSTTACPPEGAEIVYVNTTAEMLEAAKSRFTECEVFISAAAPADYAPVESHQHKRKKSGAEWTVTLQETPDILSALSRLKKNQVIVGFAAETEDLVENAAGKLKRKNLDLIVANDVTAEGAGFEVDTNVVTFLWPDGRSQTLPKLSKLQVAHRLLDATSSAIRSRNHNA